ncbi:MAG: DNA repair protein RecN, partial [Pseudomonadota bacterium]
GAGKSIILDAISLVLGGPVNRKQVRAGADQASITAEFALEADHAAWSVLESHGLDYDPEATLLLRRTVSVSGPSRAFINGQPVAAAILAELGEGLVEIHGQHAASGLMRPSTHLDLLDAFAGLEGAVSKCTEQWRLYEQKRSDRLTLEDTVQKAKEHQEWLTFAVEDLSKLSVEAGELEALSTQRGALLQSERISEAIEEAATALRDPKLETALMKSAKAVDRIVRVPGLETLESGVGDVAGAASDALERTLIELAEANTAVDTLSRYAAHDSTRLETVEARLFALRAAARKYDCMPEHLAETLDRYERELALCNSDSEALDRARQSERDAEAAWRKTAERLSQKRHKQAALLETAIHTELEPLHLGRVQVNVTFAPISEDESGAKGLERATFEVETNPGAGFGPLKAIASGGELARFSLALKCALSQTGQACTLIFDEADQGVGGAVAAAIGERLARLSSERQVFAVTHSPQVASAADRQWRVLKDADADGQTTSQVAQLDDGQRLEEIARMLSGSSITNEARAAALKLLEAA